MSSASPSTSQGKLKLLCLHGYLQNSEVFRSRIGSVRKALKSRLEFEFVEGPYEATFGRGISNTSSEETSENIDTSSAPGQQAVGRSWWQWTDVGPDGRPSRATSYTGWEPSLELLVHTINVHKPDGVFGFSQGAAATALLLSCLESRPELQQSWRPKFAIMISGFLPRDPSFAELVQKARPSVPSMFVYGTADEMVPPERTQELIAAFDQECSSVYKHAGAHLVPTCSGTFKQALTSFIDRFAVCDSYPHVVTK
ncbi:hypothetical protein CEUSTIGMA_g12610.t1 [Chlamydomonas eustigma]|uniref:Serine hydrolase domain-containing protein n=1 Tax=Chlamydomonas eustigma TaxID=1157962 RepID=A0A250XQH8_9CHLO|nr:hypothetical protein CEUSTIGMA_g12610.t1 [Chlamydomonas eustigma]|eukprot:GAX85192.1 hypothetical protein CEUSTIGMA_g12610.t1 [Chlamydomonas eustigma]